MESLSPDSKRRAKVVSFPELSPIDVSYSQQNDNRVLIRDLITSGTLGGNTVMRIGDRFVQIDPANQRFIVDDGTNKRVLIGKFPA